MNPVFGKTFGHRPSSRRTPARRTYTRTPKPRLRVCDLGYLRVAVRDEDGRLAFRCPAEPEDQYIAKAGNAEDSEGRKCLCNALMANIGLGQVRKDGTTEAPLLTSGDDLMTLGDFLQGRDHYGATDVLEYLLQPVVN